MKKKLTIVAMTFATLAIASFVVVINYTTREIEVEDVDIAAIPVNISDGSIVKWTEKTPKGKPLPPKEKFKKDSPPTQTDGELKDKKQNARDKRSAEWKKKMNDPEFQQKMRERVKAGMARRYNSLFKYLELTQEEQDGFMDIILGKFDKLKGLGQEVFGNGKLEISDETREKFDKANQEFQNAMKDYLGEDVYDLYIQYEQTQPERRHVERLNKGLAKDNGSTLTTEQQDNLITAMYKERESTDIYIMNNMSDLPNAELLTEAGTEKQIAQIDVLTQKYIIQGAEVLSEEQQTEFTKTVTKQANRQKRFLNGISGKYSGR